MKKYTNIIMWSVAILFLIVCIVSTILAFTLGSGVDAIHLF